MLVRSRPNALTLPLGVIQRPPLVDVMAQVQGAVAGSVNLVDLDVIVYAKSKKL